MRSRLLVLVIALAAFLSTAGVAAPSSQTVAAPTADRTKLQRQLNAIVARGVPGAVALVRTSDSVWRGRSGYSDVKHKIRMRTDVSFRVGSVTKTFVATLILQLAGEGKLALDDPVERWLPGAIPNGTAITVRQLLNHTSGLPNYTDVRDVMTPYATNREHVWTPTELLAFAARRPPRFTPGSEWSYSNTNYIVLGLLAEAIEQKPLGDQLRDRIFGPLGLAHTSFPSVSVLPPPYAHAYLPPKNGVLPTPGGKRVDSTVINPSVAWAAGAIVSTVDDVSRFYGELLGGRLLPPELLAAMRQTRDTGYGGGYGLGLAAVSVSCGMAWGHDGSIFGFQTFALSNARGMRQVVLMVNTEIGRRQEEALVLFLITAFCS